MPFKYGNRCDNSCHLSVAGDIVLTLGCMLPGKGAGEYPGDYAALKISDSGCGNPADAIDHLFEPGYTSKPRGKGIGLGLSMVFGFVKRSNGNIRAESKPGQGTTISLLLPRAYAVAKRPGKIGVFRIAASIQALQNRRAVKQAAPTGERLIGVRPETHAFFKPRHPGFR